MKRLPSQSTRNAPSPRTASEISGCWPRESGPSHITVGWNCTNSRSRSTAPARSASAIPSPVDDRRVGGLREHLAEAAAGEHDGPAAHRADAVALALAHHVQGEPGDAAVVGEQQVDGEGVLDHLDLGRPRDRGDQRALDLGPGGVAAGVRDPVAVVAALAGQAELAVGVVVEVGAERDQLADRLGALGDQHPDRLRVAGAGAGDQGVALVLRRGVAGAERGGDAALRPLGGARVEHVLGDHEDLVDLSAQPQRRGQAGDAGADHDDVGGRPTSPAREPPVGRRYVVRSTQAGYWRRPTRH